MTLFQATQLFRLCCDRNVYIRSIEYGPTTSAVLEVEYVREPDNTIHRKSIMDWSVRGEPQDATIFND